MQTYVIICESSSIKTEPETFKLILPLPVMRAFFACLQCLKPFAYPSNSSYLCSATEPEIYIKKARILKKTNHNSLYVPNTQKQMLTTKCQF